jgi:hypothetical protein
MSTQTDQRSLSVKPGEQQAQSSQRKEMARSSPRAGFLQRRGEYPFGLAPQEFFRAKEPLRRCLIGRRRRKELDVAGFSIADVGSGWFSI